MPHDSRGDKESADKTAQVIAYLLIGFYGTALLVIGIAAAARDNDVGGAWLDLFKSGFLILGGGLTTVIGYYFGSRGTEEAQQAADSALRQMDAMRQEMSSIRHEADKLRVLMDNLASMAPTLDEDALEVPEELSSAED